MYWPILQATQPSHLYTFGKLITLRYTCILGHWTHFMTLSSRFGTPWLPPLTLCEVVPGWKTDGLQLAVSHKLDVQVPPARAHVRGALLAAVATNDGRETEGAVADFDVVKLTFPRWLDGVPVIEEQVDALPGGGWIEQWEEEEGEDDMKKEEWKKSRGWRRGWGGLNRRR